MDLASKKRKPEANQAADERPQKVAKPVTAQEQEDEDDFEDFENEDFENEDFQEEEEEEEAPKQNNQEPSTHQQAKKCKALFN